MTSDDWFIEVNHSLRHDGHFIRLEELDDWTSKQLDVEIYTSMFRYPTPDIHVGALLAGFGMDFDCRDNPERARKEATAVIKYLIGKYAMKEQDFSIAFSGCKGFHVFINRHVLDIEPHAQLPYIFKGMAKELITECNLKTLDLRIYIATALIRHLNSRHPETGLYKIPLTSIELETMNIDRIRGIAGQKRLGILTKLTHEKNDRAAEWFERVKTGYLTKLADKRPEFSADDYQLGDLWPCVIRQIESGARYGKRNAITWQLASYFLKKGLEEEQCLQALQPWWNKTDKEPTPFPWTDVQTKVHSTYAAGGYGIGCGSEFAEDHCIGKDKCLLFKPKAAEEVLPPEAWTQADKILVEGRPLDYMTKTLESNHVGDTAILKLDYISALSARIMPQGAEQLHTHHIGKTGKGKTHSKEQVIKTLPREWFVKFSSASPMALFYYVKKYGENSLDSKVIYITEFENAKFAEPMLKALTDTNPIDPRHLSVYEAELLDLQIKGKRVIWHTSEVSFGSEQLKNRFLFANPDETPNQDHSVYTLQYNQYWKRTPTNETETSIPTLQALLIRIDKDTANLKVLIPFNIKKWVHEEDRRLFPKFAAIVKIIAKTNYKQRITHDEYLVAKEEDITEAKEIWKVVQRNLALKLSARALSIIDILRENPFQTYEELQKSTSLSIKWIRQLFDKELSEFVTYRKRPLPVDVQGHPINNPGPKPKEFFLTEKGKEDFGEIEIEPLTEEQLGNLGSWDKVFQCLPEACLKLKTEKPEKSDFSSLINPVKVIINE